MNLIYQYWDGEIPEGARAGVDNMRAYAERIGVDYLFEDNPRFCTEFGPPLDHFFGAHKPIYDDEFLKYDNVLYVDVDVFAVSGLEENIFDAFDQNPESVGICTEPFQPKHRLGNDSSWTSSENDEKWAALFKPTRFPRTEDGLLKVYNAGMVLWSNHGLRKARERFMPFRKYVDMVADSGLPHFYQHDQDWLHANLAMHMDFAEMPNDWNSIIHFYTKDGDINHLDDPRNEDTKFVHIMLSRESEFSALHLWRITNLPNSVWRFNRSE